MLVFADDRNRYVNGRVLDAGDKEGGMNGHEQLGIRAANVAVDAAFLLLTTAFDSKALAQSLPYTIVRENKSPGRVAD